MDTKYTIISICQISIYIEVTNFLAHPMDFTRRTNDGHPVCDQIRNFDDRNSRLGELAACYKLETNLNKSKQLTTLNEYKFICSTWF